jgi:hypothetical protein
MTFLVREELAVGFQVLMSVPAIDLLLHSQQTVLDYGCVALTRLLFEYLQWEGRLGKGFRPR